MNVLIVLLMVLLALWLWHKATWTEEDEFHFQQTRKELLDEYTPQERRQMACEDARHKEAEEDSARFWHY